MKTNVRTSSIEIYRELKSKKLIGKMQYDVVSYILVHGNRPLTRREIEEGMGIRGSSVVARINELLNRDMQGNSRYNDDKTLNPLFQSNNTILIERPKRQCNVTGNNVMPVVVNRGEIQRSIF